MRTRVMIRGLSGLALTVVGLSGAPASAVPILTVQIAGQGTAASVSSGTPVLVTVIADDIPLGSDGNGLFGFGFTLTVGPGPVAIGSFALDPAWTGLQSIAVASSSLSVTANRLGQPSGPAGNGIALAQFVLDGLTAGVYALTLGPLTGPGDNVLFDGTELDAQAGFFGGGILTVPEPGVVLLCAALALGAALPRASRAARRQAATPPEVFSTPTNRVGCAMRILTVSPRT